MTRMLKPLDLGEILYTATGIQVRLRTRADCELEVSVYPGFAYNATGGGGTAEAEDLGNGLLRLTFDPKVCP